MKKRVLTALLCLTMIFGLLAGCGDGGTTPPAGGGGGGGTGSGGSGGGDTVDANVGGILNSVEGFMYSTLDPHKDYNSWHSQKYGLTESLFRLTESIDVEAWVAEDLAIDDNVATLTLKDGVCFSNGNPLTADMVKRNMLRLAEVNNRFLYINDWEMEATDDKTLVITMPQILPTLRNELANPEFCMMDLDATTDVDNAPICTGPFIVDTFIPEGDLTMVRNDNYWNGNVNLDGAKFYSMSDDQSKLMAMQNGEIDAYDNITATDIELYAADPDQYQLFTVPSQARAYMFLHPDRVPASVREAILLVIDRDSIAAFMGGVLSPAYGVFSEDTAYGKVQQPHTDLEQAKQVLEADGYTLNSRGVYEKNGQALPTFGLSCYAGRNIDRIAVLIQEQLTSFGIPTEIKLVEDPDGTYITDKDFDICFYRMTTDKTGDPMPFIEGVVRAGSYQDITGYGNAATDAEVEQLRYTVDPAERAEIASKIMKDYYEANVFCALVSYNRNTVMRTGVSSFSEMNPYEFYAINADTTAAIK